MRGWDVVLPQAPRRLVWARNYDVCVGCGTTEFPHDAHGLCERCYGRSEIHKEAVRTWKGSEAGREKIASIQERYRATQKGRFMVLAAQKRRQDRIGGLVSELSALEVWIILGAFGSRCARCGAIVRLCIDHHRPLATGHPISPANAVVLCWSCNSSKKARAPEEFYPPHLLQAVEAKLRTVHALAVEIGEGP